MTPRQRIEVRKLEVQKRLRELAEVDDWTDEQTAEAEQLKTEVRSLDDRLAAAIAAEPETPEPETRSSEERELEELRSRASVGGLLQAIIAQRVPDGAIAELQQHHGLSAERVPLELLTEERAASVSLPASVNDAPTQANQQATMLPEFPTPAAMTMGIMRETVPVGQALYPVISAPTTGAAETAKGTATTDTTVTYTGAPLAPARIQGNAVIAIEDAGLFRNLEADVRRTLREVAESGLDRQAVGKLVALSATAADGTTETFATYQGVPLGLIDGVYAGGPGDISALLGGGTLAAMAGVYRGSQQVESAWEWHQETLRRVQVSGYIPAPSSGTQSALYYRGAVPAVKQPVWGMEVIVDRLTGLQSGEVRIAVITLANCAVVRSGQYHREIYDIS